VSQAITTTRQQQYGHNSNISGNSNTQSEDTYSSSNIDTSNSNIKQIVFFLILKLNSVLLLFFNFKLFNKLED